MKRNPTKMRQSRTKWKGMETTPMERQRAVAPATKVGTTLETKEMEIRETTTLMETGKKIKVMTMVMMSPTSGKTKPTQGPGNLRLRCL